MFCRKFMGKGIYKFFGILFFRKDVIIVLCGDFKICGFCF